MLFDFGLLIGQNKQSGVDPIASGNLWCAFFSGPYLLSFCRLNSYSVHQKIVKSVGGTFQPFKRQPDSFFYEGSQLWHFYVWKYSPGRDSFCVMFNCVQTMMGLVSEA